MEKVIARAEGVPSGGRNTALNHAACTLGRWIAAGALEQADIPALRDGLVRDDGERQTWATVRSGLGAGRGSPSTWMPTTGRTWAGGHHPEPHAGKLIDLIDRM